VADVALNILYGAAVLTRARIASIQGVSLPRGVPRLAPLELCEIENRLFLS
jgi:trans-AT polyketide synthase, acyltransferase and oxidoreductase domains